MFEKIRIKEHMEIVDAAGKHVGTVDEVEDERIKLTKSDAMDDQHHFVPLDAVEKLEENRIVLKEGTPLPVGLGNKATTAA